jgi:hypothetical protein
VFGHVLTVVGINIAPDKGATWSTKCPVAILKVTRRVDLIDLVAFIGVPSGTDHSCRKWVLICVDNFTHHSCCGFDGRQTTQLRGLDVHVVADISSDSAGVRGRTWSLAVDALVNRLQLIWNSVTNIHILWSLKLSKRIWLSQS